MVFGGAPTNPFGATANVNPFGSFGTAATARPFGGVQASTTTTTSTYSTYCVHSRDDGVRRSTHQPIWRDRERQSLRIVRYRRHSPAVRRGAGIDDDDEAARAIRRGTRVAVRGIRQAQQPNAGRIGRRTGFESVELDAKRTSIVVYHA